MRKVAAMIFDVLSPNAPTLFEEYHELRKEVPCPVV
jgi:hypothetical protein